MLTIILVSILGIFGFCLMLTPIYRFNKILAIFLFIVLFSLWVAILLYMNAEGISSNQGVPQPFWAR